MAEELYSILYSSNWGFFFQTEKYAWLQECPKDENALIYISWGLHHIINSSQCIYNDFFYSAIYSYSREYCVELYLARHSQANSPILKIFKEYFSSSSTWDSIIKWKKIFKKVGATCEWVYNYIHDKYYLKFKLLTISDLLTGSYIHLALLRIIWCIWIHNNFLNYYSFKYL